MLSPDEIIRLREELIATTCQYADTCLAFARINNELHRLESDVNPEVLTKRMLLVQDLEKCRSKHRVLRDVLENRFKAMVGEDEVVVASSQPSQFWTFHTAL